MTLAGYVLERSRDFREAYSLTRRLRIRFLPGTTSLDLVDVVDQLEAALSDRRSVLQEAAAKPGATMLVMFRNAVLLAPVRGCCSRAYGMVCQKSSVKLHP